MPEEKKPRRRLRRLLAGALVLLAVGTPLAWYFGDVRRPAFDPVEIGAAETRMWQAYYAEDQARLAVELVRLIGAQHRLTLVETARISEMLARAAMAFRKVRGNYRAMVLPMVTEAYRYVRDATGASFDPESAARAELAWWVARRTPGENSVDQVAAKITDLYTILYGDRRPGFEEAARLRALAASLRDQGGDRADWPTIQELLVESYKVLGRAIEPAY